MLIQFSVENYKSIKDRAVLSMEASTDKVNINNVIEKEEGRFLKSAMVFGANASGKSNLINAITTALLTIRNSVYKQPGMAVGNIIPYYFDEETKNKPSSFEFVFIYKDKKYVYGFSATRIKVVSEYLYIYNSTKASTIFQRQGEEYYFPEVLKSKMKQYIDFNSSNKLFISTASQWNCLYTKEPYEWLLNYIDTYDTRFENTIFTATEMYKNDNDNSLRGFTNNLLRQADISISDYKLNIEEKGPDNFMPSDIKKLFFSGVSNDTKFNRIEYKMLHEVIDGDNILKFELSLDEESLGTKNLFLFSPLLKRALENGSTIIVDEFDASMHPLLAKYIISQFSLSNFNKTNAQIIVTSHSTELMDLSVFRRDQYYFMDRDRNNSSSKLYSLDDFSIRSSFSKLRESYLDGRFYAIPNIGSGVNSNG